VDPRRPEPRRDRIGALALAYSFGIKRGLLAIPFALVAIGGIALFRRPILRPLAFGFIAGAAIETAFFLLLFTQPSRGLKGLWSAPR
jgi:hypothetical protein